VPGKPTLATATGPWFREIRVDKSGKLPAEGIGVDQHGGNDSLVYELGLRGITLARVVGGSLVSNFIQTPPVNERILPEPSHI